MNTAICFQCGEYKAGTFIACPKCGVVPQARQEFIVSLGISDHLATQGQLAQYSRQLRSGAPLSVVPGAMDQARVAFEDWQLQEMLGAWSPPAAGTTPAAQADTSEALQGKRPPPPAEKRQATKTALHRTPFAILGATVHDDRRRIVQLAEEKSLELDGDICQKARADLTTPRTRLSAEMAWLPGLSPDRASQLLAGLLQDPMDISVAWHASVLAELNMLAATLESANRHSIQELLHTIIGLAIREPELSPRNVLRHINEDRNLAGFPLVTALDQIEFELSERKHYYRSAIKDTLDRLPSASIVQLMTNMVTLAANEEMAGKFSHTQLADDIVDSYEVQAQGVLQKESENATQLMSALRDAVGAGEAAVGFYLDQIESVARNWNTIAHPIRLNRHRRGLDHRPASDLAWAIRNLSLELFNQHGMLKPSQRLTALLLALFSDIAHVAERVEKDAKALADIAFERGQALGRQLAWKQEITYSATLGMFKDELAISPAGISWKGHRFPLDAVTRVRWGAILRSMNGVPTGTSFTIAFGDSRYESVVQFSNEDIYTAFISKLWPAVCVRLINEMLQALKTGHAQRFGDAVLHDDGMTLFKHRLFGREKVRLTWQQLHVWSADGMFFIGAQADKKTYAGISYIDGVNTHILEHAIRAAFKHAGMNRLSDLLQ